MSDVDLRVLMEANRQVLAELDRRLAKAEERAEKARALLADCDAERREIDTERQAVMVADRIYRRVFIPRDDDDHAVPLPPRDAQPALDIPGGRKPRARIGPQRYRIMTFLRRQIQAVDDEEIVRTTQLPGRRVRAQLRSDVDEGFVLDHGGKFVLTDRGLDLLERFENYKRSQNEPLPSLTGEIFDDDSEVDADVESEETELA